MVFLCSRLPRCLSIQAVMITKIICTKLGEASVLWNLNWACTGPQSHVLYSTAWCRHDALANMTPDHCCGASPRHLHTLPGAQTEDSTRSETRQYTLANCLQRPYNNTRGVLLQSLHTPGRKRPGLPSWLQRTFSSVVNHWSGHMQFF